MTKGTIWKKRIVVGLILALLAAFNQYIPDPLILDDVRSGPPSFPNDLVSRSPFTADLDLPDVDDVEDQITSIQSIDLAAGVDPITITGFSGVWMPITMASPPFHHSLRAARLCKRGPPIHQPAS